MIKVYFCGVLDEELEEANFGTFLIFLGHEIVFSQSRRFSSVAFLNLLLAKLSEIYRKIISLELALRSAYIAILLTK